MWCGLQIVLRNAYLSELMKIGTRINQSNANMMLQKNIIHSLMSVAFLFWYNIFKLKMVILVYILYYPRKAIIRSFYFFGKTFNDTKSLQHDCHSKKSTKIGQLFPNTFAIKIFKKVTRLFVWDSFLPSFIHHIYWMKLILVKT